MPDIREAFDEQNIHISLQFYGERDIATNWEIETIIEHPDIFSDIYEKYPLMQVKTIEEYFLYLLSQKFATLSSLLPRIIDDKNKEIIGRLAEQSQTVSERIRSGEIISFINNDFQSIFDCQNDYDMQEVTLNLIMQYIEGIDNAVIEYLCHTHGYMIIDNYNNFEKRFEKDSYLFSCLFPSGKLSEITHLRFKSILDIWSHLITKEKSTNKDTVLTLLPVLYGEIVQLSNKVTIDDIYIHERTFRQFNEFLQKIKSPLANDFSKIAKAMDDLLDRRIIEKGHLFEYEIPVKKILDSIRCQTNWWNWLLAITHSRMKTNNGIEIKSLLDDNEASNLSIIDLVGTNIPTDDYFTMSQQRMIQISLTIGTAVFMGILRDEELMRDYLNYLGFAFCYISETTGQDTNETSDDLNMLFEMIQSIAINIHNEDGFIVSSCYGASMYLCALSEKVLRNTYRYIKKDNEYVPIDKATLGNLLNENNKEIVSVFGMDHVKNLAYFLNTVGNKKIGYNIRNSLAHWVDLSCEKINESLVCTLLWILTDIINTVTLFLICKTDERNGNDKL